MDLKNYLTTSLFGLLLLTGCGKPINVKENQSSYQNPLLQGVSEEMLLDTKMSLNFELLPLKGDIRKTSGKFWSGDSWRLQKGSINNRWNSETKEGFGYLSPSSRELTALPLVVLKSLSPAEKYDIYMGRYDYPLKSEVDWLARSGQESWEGLCHGWAGASMNHTEPDSITVKNPDGIEVHFGSSDIKALLTYAYSKLLIRPEESIGKRCEEWYLISEDHCNDDLTALTFHAVLANKIGLRGQGFIADMDRYKEVWNHPITGYESKIEKMQNTANGMKAIVSTKVSYVDVIEKNAWDKGAIKNIMSYMTVRYELTLDKQGNMLGSRWLTRERPDFLWTVSEPYEFDGYLSEVKKLLK